MTAYPTGTYAPRTKANEAGIVYDVSKTTINYAEDIVNLDNEVVAIETELGTSPKGRFASVKKAIEWLVGLVTLPWESADGVTVELGSVTPLSGNLQLNCGTGSGDEVLAIIPLDGAFKIDLTSNPCFEIKFLDDSNTDYDVAFGFTDGGEPPDFNAILFFIQDNALFTQMYDTVSTVETSDEVIGVDTDGVHTYRIEVDGGTSVKFYVDNVLKKTYTQYIPSTSSGLYFVFHVMNNAAANTLSFSAGPLSLHENFIS